jgi:pimeloyl-ACP methyl ester carboxylesterase
MGTPVGCDTIRGNVPGSCLATHEHHRCRRAEDCRRSTDERRISRMIYFKSILIVLISLVGWSVEADEARHETAHPSRCDIGTYRLSDGTMLDIGPGAAGRLRWRLLDGRTGELTPQKNGRWVSTLGWTQRADGHVVTISDCRSDKVKFDDVIGHRQPLIQIDTRFRGSGTDLAGRLTLPSGTDKVPIVVLIHGAEHFSALENYSLQRQFAGVGIGVFAYDKRGTGNSGGRYTQNYLTLATDAVFAMREARRLAGARAGRVGYQGGSQGGWVAPLAARIEPVDFVIVSFGLAVSVLDEDREAIELDMELGGFGPQAKAKAMEVADATAAIVGSNFNAGYEQLELVKRNYGEEPWFKAVRGNFSKYLLDTPVEISRKEGAILLEGVPAQYDPMPVLSNLSTPQLWLLGGQDRDAPPAETMRRLNTLRKEGRPITLIVYPNAEHGMYEFESLADGERVSTRQPEGYFDAMRDFIKIGH